MLTNQLINKRQQSHNLGVGGGDKNL